MDDFLEHMLSVTPWTEMGGMSNSIGNQGLSSQAQELHGNLKHAEVQANLQYSLEDQLIISSLSSPIASTPNDSSATGQPLQHNPDMVLSPMKKISEGMSNISLLVPQNDSMNTMVASVSATQLLAAAGGFPRGLPRSVSIGSSRTEGSAIQQVPPNSQSSPGAAPTWCQPYIGAGVHHPIMKRESFLQCEATSDDAQMLVKRSRTDNEDGLFMSFGGTQTGQRQIARVAGQESNLSAGEGISVSPYGSHTGLAQPQNTSGIVPITAKPRVRARRGQATDPHSIAERLRRERIAARMKALQELVPNSNKTDKASMLDEIIEYVKFLQLQVKVLSMSRLGGSSGVAPLVADLPTEGVVGAGLAQNVGSSVSSQDGMAVAERQVARLMEEDMGSAMQYLQSKGLCLMPISLATTISTTSSRSQINNNSQGGIQGLGLSNECPRLDVATSTPATSSITSVASGAIPSPANNASDPVSNDSAGKGSNGGFDMDIKRMPSIINP